MTEDQKAEAMKELVMKLADVQSKLKANKDKQNKFGGYAYRTAEGILASVKPLLAEHNLFIMIGDEMVQEGDAQVTSSKSVTKTTDKDGKVTEKVVESSTTEPRFYLKATVVVTDGVSQMSCSAFARESFSKKGMDDAMVTGSASSYARKYALNGMFGIDDAKQDPDRGHTKMFEAVDKKLKGCETKEDGEKLLKSIKASKVDAAVKKYAQEEFDKKFQ